MREHVYKRNFKQLQKVSAWLSFTKRRYDEWEAVTPCDLDSCSCIKFSLFPAINLWLTAEACLHCIRCCSLLLFSSPSAFILSLPSSSFFFIVLQLPPVSSVSPILCCKRMSLFLLLMTNFYNSIDSFCSLVLNACIHTFLDKVCFSEVAYQFSSWVLFFLL